jgi:short-subunit dehydrogenase
MKKSWLDNKTIMITGASSGIGRALVKLFVTRHNCNIIGIGRSEEKLKQVASELGDNFQYRIMDVSIESNWKELSDFYKDKSIDILINNAGILPPFASFDKLIKHKNTRNSIDNKSSDIISDTIQTNFMSVIYSTEYFMNIIETSETPAIINVASSSGLCALPGTAIYSASKSAVKNFTECLMCEKDYYIGLVCPGFTKTNIFRMQTKKTDSKLINLIATDLNKMAYKIYRGIRKKKRRMVYGVDAKFMDKLYRHMPNKSLKILTRILKSSKVELFEDVF